MIGIQCNLQLYAGELHVQVHRRFINDFSTACYVITRHHAEKLIKLHVRGSQYKLDNGVKPRPVADDLIYNSGASYACPILLYKIELGSSIHEEHIEIFHRGSHDGLRELWSTRGATLPLTCYQILIPIWVGLQANIHRIKDKGLTIYSIVLYYIREAKRTLCEPCIPNASITRARSLQFNLTRSHVETSIICWYKLSK